MEIWYWNQRKYEGLKSIIDYLAKSGIADGFNEYCALLEKGLRKQALDRLKTFIQETATWDITRRREFVDWVLCMKLGMPEVHGFVPFDLQTKLIEPTLENWIHEEPLNNRPLRWSNKIGDIRRAIEVDGGDQIAKMIFAFKVLSYADYETHELPSGFLGDDPGQTLNEVVESIKYLEEVSIDGSVKIALSKLHGIEERLRAYMKSRS